MEKLWCRGCGESFYSAAARALVEEGRRCERCGGELTRHERSTGASRDAEERDEPPKPPA